MIRKRTVPLPDLSGFVYAGSAFVPSLPPSDDYTAELPRVFSEGVYSAVFRLTDPENTRFARSDLPEITLEFTVARGMNAPRLLLALLAVCLILLSGYILVFRRRSLRSAPARTDSSPSPLPEGDPPARLVSCPQNAALPVGGGDPFPAPIGRSLLAVDCERADGMISDDLAKDLLERRALSVSTVGRRHAAVNVDSLSASFAAGETVDINRLKERGLIPKDAGRLKVLARGSIDKPLTVLADAFTPCAVKMIALTGGRALLVRTERRKK